MSLRPEEITKASPAALRAEVKRLRYALTRIAEPNWGVAATGADAIAMARYARNVLEGDVPDVADVGA